MKSGNDSLVERKRRPKAALNLILRPLGASGTSHGVRSGSGGQATFTLRTLPGELAGTADGLGLLARLLFGGLLVVVAKLHLAEDAFALELLLQSAQRLVNIVIANNYLQAEPPFVIVISV